MIVYLNTREVASLLCVHPQTLRRWQQLGVGPRYMRLGAGPKARVRYNADDVEAWAASHTYETEEEGTSDETNTMPEVPEESDHSNGGKDQGGQGAT